AVTSRIRLATIVLDNDFRHPATLLKEVATVDVLTDHRFELGLGAGWLQADYTQTGIPFESPAQRIERLEEAIQNYRAFFTHERVTFAGKHYQIDALEAFPRVARTPPLMLGGRQKRMLTLAGREADIVSISMLDRWSPGLPKPPSIAQKLEWVHQGAGAR